MLYPLPKLVGKNFKIHPSLEAIVRKCAEKKPSDRYQNAHQVVHEISRHI